jgi:hypothetical protein
VAETNVDDIVISAVRDFEMPHSSVSFIREIGSGEFGVVMEASATGLPNSGLYQNVLVSVAQQEQVTIGL